MAVQKNTIMKSSILSFLGIGAIALAVACNSSDDETTNADSTSTTTTTTVDNTVATGTGEADIQTSGDGRKYIIRKRTTSASTSGSTSGTASSGSDYDTVWLYAGTENRYYTLGGSKGRDTLYYNTDQWNTWWNNSETDNELKSKTGNTKVKVDDDGSWKVKDENSKTKMNEKGEVKTKPKN
jgi:hypothetical protein